MRICSFTKARIFLLHVIEDIPEWVFHHPMYMVRALRTRDRGGSVLRAAEEIVQRNNIPVHSLLRPAEGQPLHRLIVAAAEAAQTDLVVMGSQRKFAIGPFEFAGMAQKVVRLCPVPVMVLRGK